jgi:hypothetical protein
MNKQQCTHTHAGFTANKLQHLDTEKMANVLQEAFIFY